MTDEKEFIFEKAGHTMGNLICSYLKKDKRVCYVGYRVNNTDDLTIKIRSTPDSPDVCMNDAIKQCKEIINNLTT